MLVLTRGDVRALLDPERLVDALAAAVAVRALAREDARTLAVVGTGVQGRAHARVVARARAFAEVRIAGRGDVREAVRDADVVCLCTSASQPVIEPDWIRPDAHVG